MFDKLFGKKPTKASPEPPRALLSDFVEVRNKQVSCRPRPTVDMLRLMVRQKSAFTAPVARGGPLFQAFADAELTEAPAALAEELNSLMMREEERAQQLLSGYTLSPPLPESESGGETRRRSSPIVENAPVQEFVRPENDDEEQKLVLEMLAVRIADGIEVPNVSDFHDLAGKAVDEVMAEWEEIKI